MIHRGLGDDKYKEGYKSGNDKNDEYSKSSNHSGDKSILSNRCSLLLPRLLPLIMHEMSDSQILSIITSSQFLSPDIFGIRLFFPEFFFSFYEKKIFFFFF
jgi:hypothetical protein